MTKKFSLARHPSICIFFVSELKKFCDDGNVVGFVELERLAHFIENFLDFFGDEYLALLSGFALLILFQMIKLV